MAYGIEAMSPIEVGLHSHSHLYFIEISSNKLRRCELDFVKQMRDNSQMKLTSCEREMARYCNVKVKKMLFSNGRPCIKEGFSIF